MKRIISTALLLILSIHGFAQLEWTWMSGSTNLNAAGVYNSQGTSGGAPGARRGSEMVADNSGNLWLFGGAGIDGSGLSGRLNDLWKYDPVTEEWTWINGATSRNTSGVYGTQGVSSPSNQPGGRSYFAMTIDDDDNIWIIGGHGYASNSFLGHLSDIWKYNTSSGEWTWIDGSNFVDQSSRLGNQGTASSLNEMGGVQKFKAAFDSNGDLWSYGGYGLDSLGNIGVRSDLMKYDTTLNKWTWMYGTGTVNSGFFGTCGNPGVYDPSNSAPPLQFYQMRITPNDEIVILGGDAEDNVVRTRGIDFSYNISTNQWKCTLLTAGIAFPSFPVLTGYFDHQTSNHPGTILRGALVGNSERWYLFGGLTSLSGSSYYRDLLMTYQLNTSSWAEISGTFSGSGVPGPAPVYGSLGIPSSTNALGTLHDFASCMDQNGEIWVFGGNSQSSTSRRATLWKMSPRRPTRWNGTTWSDGNPADTMAVIISSSDSVPQSISCEVLSIDPGVTLNIPANDTVVVSTLIKDFGDGVAGPGVLVIRNGANDEVEIVDDTLVVHGLLDVETVSTLRTNGKVKIAATSASDHGTLKGTGLINGNVAAEAWLDLPGGGSDARYYHLGIPFSNATISQLTNGSNRLISANDNTGTIWEWDAANAEWTAAGSANLATTPTAGTGMAVFGGDLLGVTFLRSGAGVINVSGSPIVNDVAIPVAYNDGQASSVTFVGGTSQAATEGWNLVANPFLAEYDWFSHFNRPAGMSTAKYVWNGTTYEVYNQGVGSGSAFIAPWQAFWVQFNTDPGTPQVLEMDEALRSNPNGTSLRKAVNIDGIDVIVTNASGISDEFYVGFDNGSTVDFDGAFDAFKLLNGPSAPTMSVVLNSEYLSICRVPLQTISAFPINLQYANQGEQMTIEMDDAELHAYREVWLEDLKLGVMHNLENPYSFYYDSNYPNRFILRFKQSTIGVEEEANAVQPFAWLDQETIVVEPMGVENMEIAVYDISGQLVANYTGANSNQGIRMPVDAHGVYVVMMTWSNGFRSQRIVK